MSPTFVAEYEATWTNTTSPKTVSVTTEVGDVLVCFATTGYPDQTVATPTGGTGLVWTLRQSVTGVTGRSFVAVWTAVATVAETFTLSLARSGGTATWGFNCLRYSNATGVGASTKANASSSAPSLALTTTDAGSAVVVAVSDYDSADGVNRAWRTGAGALTEVTYSRASSSPTQTVYGGYHADAGAAGAKTVGLTAPTMTYSIVAVEVLGVTPVKVSDSGSGQDQVSVAPAVALVDTGTGVDSATTAPALNLTDTGTGTDSVDAGQWLAQATTDAGTGSDSVAVTRTTYVGLTESGTGTDPPTILRATGLTDTGVGTDTTPGVVRSTGLTDTGTGTDALRVVDIPFTRVLPLRLGPVYDLVVVARVPQVNGPPALIEVDPIEWKDLKYGNTLSASQDLEASCLISSVTEAILQRLRQLSELATELWLYRNGRVVFAGPLVGWRSSGESLTLSAQGLLAYLNLMVVTADLRFDQVDQFAVVKTLVDQWQALDYGNFGIDTANVGASGVLRDGTYLKSELHNVGQRVAELGQRINGFDAEVDPVTRGLKLWYPVKGVDRSSGEDAIVVDARNITSGDTLCSVAAGDLASEAFGTGSSAGGDSTLFSTQSNTELRARYGRTAITGTWSDVSEQTTLDAHTKGMLDARAETLIVPGPDVRVTPDADLDDYSVGDTIAYDLASQLGISGAFRIRKQNVSVSSTGQESVTLEFV